MKLYNTTIILIMFLTNTFSQEHYISYIDFNNTGQFARQIEPNDDDFLLSIQTTCLDTVGSCGGIVMVDNTGELINFFYLKNLVEI